MPRNNKFLIPFLQVLKDVTHEQRSVILAHLDDKSCDALYKTIVQVMRNKKMPDDIKDILRKSLNPVKDHLQYIATPGKSKIVKRRKLQQLGGFPLAAVLSAAIPLLLNLFSKK